MLDHPSDSFSSLKGNAQMHMICSYLLGHLVDRKFRVNFTRFMEKRAAWPFQTLPTLANYPPADAAVDLALSARWHIIA